jgi:plastocyanin
VFLARTPLEIKELHMRNWKLIVGVVVVVLLLVGGAAAFALTNTLGEAAAGDVRPGPADDPAAQVVMVDDRFEPTSINVPAGTTIEIELTNSGDASHNFTSEALNVSTGPMQAGDVTTVSLTVPVGATQFVCTWHPGMVIDVVGS